MSQNLICKNLSNFKKCSSKNAEKRVFSCKNRCRYSRKRATFCRNFAKNWHLPKKLSPGMYEARPTNEAQVLLGSASEAPPQRRPLSDARVRGLGSAKLANFAKFCKFLAGSFSAVSKRNFARKYAFDSIFQALQDICQDLHTFAPLQSQKFSKKIRLKNQHNFRENSAFFL